jgi:pleiotropic regulator 1
MADSTSSASSSSGLELDVASCAASSLKRSRILFGATHAFVPTLRGGDDATDLLVRNGQNRRRRIPGGTATAAAAAAAHGIPAGTSSSQALVVAAGTRTGGSTKSNAASTSMTASIVPSQKGVPGNSNTDKSSGILVPTNEFSHKRRNVDATPPAWHAPWKLSAVLSSHLGWVRSIAMDPTNKLFATGSADRTIKIWNLASASVGDEASALQLTLTGHISPVRGLAFSPRHPYLFSAGEDKTVKCWDLETNQVVRHYHGHLSGVYCLKLHPTLDIVVTGGRDAVARVWDMRTKTQIHCLSGHDNTVGCLLVNSVHPSVVTGSQDSTVKLWDLVAGKCVTTLTHHRKGIRALVQAPFERTFCSGASDGLKKFTSSKGQFLKTLSGHKAVINAMAINDDGVLVSGGDDGTMRFWDYNSGYAFQDESAVAQPGSLEAENGIMALEFDLTGTRLITGECDKTIKIWRQDDDASELTHPVDLAAWRKQCLAEAKQRY